MTERRFEHLEPATIAALVDRTLDPAARAAAEAHLAVCADCREVWVETSEMAEATRASVAASDAAAAPTVLTHRPRTRRWIYAGAGLAMAAVLTLAVFSPQLFDRGPRPELRELVEAVGENRRTEGRLTGGFRWGPAPSAIRSASDGNAAPELRIAAAGVEQALADRRDAPTLAAAGTARLLIGQIDASVAVLEEAARLEPKAAQTWSDLAAAHLEGHRVDGRSGHAVRAYEAAERALLIDPLLVEARFNRALALERLNRNAEAVSAWRHYLKVETVPTWRTEAEARISKLATAG